MNRVLPWKESYTVTLVQNLDSMTVCILNAEKVVCSVEIPDVRSKNCLLYKNALFFFAGNWIGKADLAALLKGSGDAAVCWLELFDHELKGSEPGGYYYPPLHQLLYIHGPDLQLILWSHYKEYDPAEAEESLLRSSYRIRIIQPEPFCIEKEIDENNPAFTQYMPDEKAMRE